KYASLRTFPLRARQRDTARTVLYVLLSLPMTQTMTARTSHDTAPEGRRPQNRGLSGHRRSGVALACRGPVRWNRNHRRAAGGAVFEGQPRPPGGQGAAARRDGAGGPRTGATTPVAALAT